MAGIGSGAGSFIGSIIGGNKASGDQAQAQADIQAAYQQLAAVGVPPDLAQQVILQQYKSAGNLTPALEQAINLGPSQVANIQTDPNLANAQNLALQQMQQAGQTGMTAQDQLAYANMINQINAQNQGRQGAILQQAQAMNGGVGSQGATLAAQLNAAQTGANQASQQGLQLAAQQNAARMNALAQSGTLASQLRGQQFGEAETKANAADQFQRFNVQNQQAIANQNIQNQNAAQQYNLQNSQNLMNANTQQGNQEALRENQAQLQDWQNQLGYAQAKSNALIGQGNYLQGQANQIQNQATQQGAALGGVAGGIASLAMGAPSMGGGGGQSAFNFQGPSAYDANSSGGPGEEWPSGIGSDGNTYNSAYAAHGGMIKDNMYHYGGQVPGLNSPQPQTIPQTFANGGVIKDEEKISDNNETTPRGKYNSIKNDVNQFVKNNNTNQFSNNYYKTPNSGNSIPPSKYEYLNNAYAMGGIIPVNNSLLQKINALNQIKALAQKPIGGMVAAQHGGIMPGQAVVAGDNKHNDIVHALVSPDEIVLPRSITTMPDAPERAKEFVKGVLSSKKNKMV